MTRIRLAVLLRPMSASMGSSSMPHQTTLKPSSRSSLQGLRRYPACTASKLSLPVPTTIRISNW